MTGILGRMAAESGKEITWDEALASKLELAPGLDKFTWTRTPPVMPDAQGRYPDRHARHHQGPLSAASRSPHPQKERRSN